MDKDGCQIRHQSIFWRKNAQFYGYPWHTDTAGEFSGLVFMAGNSGGAEHHLKNWGQNQKIFEISHLKKKIVDEKVCTLHK